MADGELLIDRCAMPTVDRCPRPFDGELVAVLAAFIPEPVELEEESAAATTPRCSWRTAPPPAADATGRAPMSERQQLALLLQMTSPGEFPADPAGRTDGRCWADIDLVSHPLLQMDGQRSERVSKTAFLLCQYHAITRYVQKRVDAKAFAGPYAYAYHYLSEMTV